MTNSKSTVSLASCAGSLATSPVTSQQYVFAAAPLGTSTVAKTTSESSASTWTVVSLREAVSDSEAQPLSDSWLTARLIVALLWPVFSTSIRYSICSSPSHSTLRSDSLMVRSTPKRALPEPSAAVVVTTSVEGSGISAVGAPTTAVMVAVMVVSQAVLASTV